MKKLGLLLLSAAFMAVCALNLALAAEGDYYIEEMVISNSLFGNVTDTTFNKTWISGDKIRREQGGTDQITIGRLDKGLFWVINLIDSTYSEINLTTIRQMAMLSVAMMGPPMEPGGEIKVPDDLYVKTGEKQKVGIWTTEKVELNSKYAGKGIIEQFTMWIAKDIDVPKDLYSNLMKNIFGDPNGEIKKLLNMWKDLGGYPVLLEMSAMGVKNKTITTKIEKKSAPEALFKLPEGLTEVANPFIEQMNEIQGR